MKNTLLLGTMLVSMASLFTACEDDRDSNPTLIQPTDLVLNTPAYINETINLENSSYLKLTWSQPKFTADNAPVNATYEIQVSPTNSFTVSAAEADADESGALVADYDVLPNTVTTCHAIFEAQDLDKALIKVAKWTNKDVPAEQTAYIRVQGYILEGTKKVNSIASNNVVELKVNPYYIELKDADPIMWYLLGNNIGDGGWSTDNANIGISTMPMFLKPGFTYDKVTGGGEIEFLNYFTMDGFKINPANLNDWDHGFMSSGSANEAIYRDANGDKGNIWVDPAGYYRITLNTSNNTCKIEKMDITPKVYDMICITGSFCGWTDVNMTPANKVGENHVWTYTLTVPAGATEQIKFKIAGSWDTNWGYGSADGEVNNCGEGSQGAPNIGVPEGTWVIMFNDINGNFSIIKKQQ